MRSGSLAVLSARKETRVLLEYHGTRVRTSTRVRTRVRVLTMVTRVLGLCACTKYVLVRTRVLVCMLW
jgi:hypothetical protein